MPSIDIQLHHHHHGHDAPTTPADEATTEVDVDVTALTRSLQRLLYHRITQRELQLTGRPVTSMLVDWIATTTATSVNSTNAELKRELWLQLTIAALEAEQARIRRDDEVLWCLWEEMRVLCELGDGGGGWA